MSLLPIPTSLDNRHDDVFGRHEWQLLAYPPRYDLRVYDEAFAYILQCSEYDISSQKCFRESNATIRTLLMISRGYHLSIKR